MAVVLIVNLYTVRVVLHALGDEGYGIYNVVAGIITMLASFSTVFSSATQRFLSFSLGSNDPITLNKIFSASSNIFYAISIISLLLGETLGLWFINTQLVIPIDRIVSANWIYQFSILSFLASMLASPYLAASIAHEDMGLFAIVTTIDAALKLCFAFAIPYIPIDHLTFYGFYLLVIQFFTFCAYFFVCRKRYSECHYSATKDWKLHREILSFSGWTLFSSFAVIGVNQGIAILINIFFGPLINAALAIAFQVNSTLSTFCNSFIMAVRPPMIKAYSEERYDYLTRLFSISNKFTYYCLFIIAIPLIFEMSFILHIWLGDVSTETVTFCQLGVVYSVILAMCNPISIIVQATGKIRQFTVPVELVTISTPIVVFILFKLGFAAVSAFYVMIVVVSISQIVRLIYLKKVFPAVSIRNYIVGFMIPAVGITFLTIPCCYMIYSSISDDIIRFIGICLTSLIVIMLLTSVLGLSNTEKQLLKSILLKK